METRPKKTENELRAEDDEVLRRMFSPEPFVLTQGTSVPSPELITQYYDELEDIRYAHELGAIAARDCLVG